MHRSGGWLESLSSGPRISLQSAADAAKSLQSCPTLCDPIDSSPPGSPVPGILQARTLEWVAISFSNAWKWKVKVKSLSHVRLFTTLWTVAYQAPPSMGFSRQEYWSGVPLPSLLQSASLGMFSWWRCTSAEYRWKDLSIFQVSIGIQPATIPQAKQFTSLHPRSGWSQEESAAARLHFGINSTLRMTEAFCQQCVMFIGWFTGQLKHMKGKDWRPSVMSGNKIFSSS